MQNRVENSRTSVENSRYPELNEVYAWQTSAHFEFQQVKQPRYPYREGNEIKTAEPGQVYVYSQSIVVNKVCKGITLVTKEKRKTYVKEFFNKVEELLEKDPSKFLKAQETPAKLGISYE